ncbi:hypothetical protein MMC29_005210 [Sticta canariensis]|nr:hypothetical protein [Sticta canariensis]
MALFQKVPYDPSGIEIPNFHNMLVSGLLRTCADYTKNSTLKISCSVTVWLDAIRDRVTELLESGKCDTYGKVLIAVDEEETERYIEKTVAAKVANGEVDGVVEETGTENALAENSTNLQLGGGAAPAMYSIGGPTWSAELESAWQQMRRDDVPGWRTKGPAQHRARENLMGNTMSQQLRRALRKATLESADLCAQEALDRMRKEMDEAKNQKAA